MPEDMSVHNIMNYILSSYNLSFLVIAMPDGVNLSRLGCHGKEFNNRVTEKIVKFQLIQNLC